MLVIVDKVVTRLDTLKHQQVVRGCDMCRGESQRLRTGAAKMGLLGRRAVFAAMDNVLPIRIPRFQPGWFAALDSESTLYNVSFLSM